MKKTLPLVSFIIANWNGKKYLEACLSSIAKQTMQCFEVILIDNGSSDGSVDYIKEHYPQVVVVENNINVGFSVANNQGIKLAKGKYIATLNNDTELDEEWIENILKIAELSPANIGMWAAKILSFHDRKHIDSVGGLLIYGDGLARGRGRGEEDKGQYDDIAEILFPSACCALYRKALFDQLGGFDEDFFAYCEDTDLGIRARLAGWGALSVPNAVVYHYYSGTTGKYSQMKAFLVERNRAWLVFKNFPLGMILVSPYYTVWRWTVQFAGVASGKGATSQYVQGVSFIEMLTVFFKVGFSTLRGMPLMLKKRKAFYRGHNILASAVKKLFDSNSISAAELVRE